MALIDSRLEFCSATALNTGAAGNYNIGDIIDTTVKRDLGVGEQMWLVIGVTTSSDSAGDTATATFSLLTSAAADLGSPSVIVTSPTWLTTAMVKGTRLFSVALPMEGVAYLRYLGIRQTTGVQAFTAGNIDAYLTTQPPTSKAYPDGLPAGS